MQSETEWAIIGNVVAPFGIRGEVKVFLQTDIPNRFASLTSVYLGPDRRLCQIEKVRPYKATVIIVKFRECPDMNTAETWRGKELAIPLSDLAPLPPDAYYQHDILGLSVVTLQGQNLGKIVEILPTGGNDVYIVKAPAGAEVLIPAIKQVVKQIDLSNQVILIDPLPGLLDDEALIDDGQDRSPDDSEEPA